MELADIVAVLAKTVREDILSKVPPRLFFILDLPIVLSAKLIKVSELLLQSRVSFGGWPVRWFWRRWAWAAWHTPRGYTCPLPERHSHIALPADSACSNVKLSAAVDDGRLPIVQKENLEFISIVGADMKSLLAFALVVACMLLFGPVAYCQNAELAKDLAEEGVSNEAKVEFIKVLHDPAKKSSYDLAEYYLGYLDFKEKKFELALKHWNTLVQKYPNSTYSQKAKDLINSAYQQLSKVQILTTQDIDIDTLFENANLFVDRPLKVNLDTSYLATEDMAIEWLEKVVSKYPKTPEAARALFREALVYDGWGKEGIGSYSSAEGYGFRFQLYYAKNKNRASEYLNKIVQIFNRLQSEYPDSRYAIPTAYLIGQAYWSLAGGKLDENSRVYWNKVLTLTANDSASDYRQIVEWRLRANR